MIVKHVSIPISRTYKSHRGLAEKLVKKRLEYAGWQVWRGNYINALTSSGPYPNVVKKYYRLYGLLKKHYPTALQQLKYLCLEHHGIPDFICYKDGFKFVECKLGDEQLSEKQKKCIVLLQRMGFPIEVHKLVFNAAKNRIVFVHMINGRKWIVEKQTRLKLRWKKTTHHQSFRPV